LIILHHPDCAEYAAPGHPERPVRVVATAARLRGLPGFEWSTPSPAPDAAILRAHDFGHIARLHEPRPFDGDTPYHENLDGHARMAAGAAVMAAELAMDGHPSFSLMRPPGHHATRDRAMGFCYLNNIAIAALHARAGGTERVAIWDFDAHHGNGTEAIVRGVEGVRFVSVHQFPGYPGTGARSDGNCLNFPVLPDTPAPRHMEILRESWGAVLEFGPSLVLVSAGFDAYRHDPITTMCLGAEDFVMLGAWMHDSGLPAAALLEGGYSDHLPTLVAGFLEGWMHG
jgi:acetoin utilization deacetylase AcuC-like enzyme